MLNSVSTYAGNNYLKWTLYRFTNPADDRQCTDANPCLQDFITATYKAPEPGSLALFGLALLGLGATRRRRA